MPRNLKKRGRIWWYRFQKNGSHFEGSLDTENLGVAQERVRRKLEELRASKWGEKPRRSFNEAAEEFGKRHFKKLAPASRQRYVVSIANLLVDFDKVYLDDIGSAKLLKFEERRREQGATNSTIRRDFACLSVIFSKAQAWEWITFNNPVKAFLSDAGLKENPARDRYLSAEEEAEITPHMPPKAAKGLLFAIETGLRKEEQFGVLWTAVDFPRRRLLVRAETAKGEKSRWVPLLPRVYDILKQMHAEATGPYIFTTYEGKPYSKRSPYYYEALQKAVHKANKARAAKGRPPMAHVEWHDLRRTCGCRLLQDRGFSMEEVSGWLGHSSVKVTERHYAFLRIEHLQEAVERSEARVIELHQRRASKSGQ
jgi:integrase/recombinase XerD